MSSCRAEYPTRLEVSAPPHRTLPTSALARRSARPAPLLVARRVKRQTLGLEPTEIAGLVEHRDAMLHGIREGVVALDLRGRVTLINDEAIRLLHIPADALGRTLDELGVGRRCATRCSAATRSATAPSPARPRCSSINRLPSPAGGGRSAR